MIPEQITKAPHVGQSALTDGLGPFEICEHPDHNEQTDCQDRAVGCSKHCICCMGDLAIPVPNAEIYT